MSVYLDASVLVALFTSDAFSSRADEFLARNTPILMVSDFAAAEFASAIARRMRMGEMSENEARRVFSTFDVWTAQSTQRLATTSTDVGVAEGFLRRLDLPLRTPDALNIALALRSGASIATFDEKMAVSAKGLGVAVAVM